MALVRLALRARRLLHGLFERCPSVRLFQCSLLLGLFERGRRGTQLPSQRVSLVGDLRKILSDLRVVGGATFRIGGALRCVARLGVLVSARRLSIRCSAAACAAAAAASATSNSASRSARSLCRRDRICRAVLFGALECCGGVGQLPCQRVTLVGDLRKVCSDFRVVGGATFRIGGALRCVARLGVLEVSSKALDPLFRCGTRSSGGRERDLELRLALRQLLCRRDRVCRAVLLGLLECRGTVAQLPFESRARRRSLRHGLLERGPGVRLFQCALLLGFFKRGRRGAQLPCQRVTLVGDLRKVRSDLRVVSSATLRIGGALRCVARLGVLVSARRLSICCSVAARAAAAAASATSNSAWRSASCCAAATASAARCSWACSSAAPASLSCRSKASRVARACDAAVASSCAWRSCASRCARAACATVCSSAARASVSSSARCFWESSSAADAALSCRASASRSSEICARFAAISASWAARRSASAARSDAWRASACW